MPFFQERLLNFTALLFQPMRVMVSLVVVEAELLLPSFVVGVSSGSRRIGVPSRKRINVGRSNDAGSRLIPNSCAISP